MHVAICAATFRRPEMLAEMLDGIGALQLAEFARTRITVVIADNDAAGSSRDVVDAVRSRLPFDVRYVVEPQRGIAAARNCVIAVALAIDADFVALIDDDEVPNVDWLAHLFRAQERFAAEAVYGPVKSRFVAPPPAWVMKGRFFDRSVTPTGRAVPIGTTGNVLLTRRLLEAHNPPFDIRFGLTGGEDTHFFLGLQRDGVPVISCAEAVVVETVPPARATAGYLLRRAYASGSSYVSAERSFAGGLPWTTRRALIAFARIGEGLALAFSCGVFGKHLAVRGLQKVALGTGMLAGLRGVRFEHYRSTEGA